MAKPEYNFSLIERGIAAISPKWAYERHKTRVAMAVTGGYSGAGYSERMRNWTPGGGDADTDIVRDLRELRARSRDLVRNSPVAGGAIETQVTNIVGTGLSVQPRINAKLLGMSTEQAKAWQDVVMSEFSLWAESVFCDYYQQQTFYEMQDLALRAALESGDSFGLMTDVKIQDWPYKLALQIIEADRVSNPDGSADTATQVQGIEKSDSGIPVAAHVCNKHPQQYGSYAQGAKWTRVAFRSGGRTNLIHLYRKIRPTQSRGVPCLAPVIEPLKQLARYTEAEIAAAVVAGSFAVFVKMDSAAFDTTFNADAQATIVNNAKSWDGTIQPGSAVNLLPGESIETADASRPNPNFDPFVSAIMGQIGIGLNIPKEVLMKHFQSSYSAARAALMDAWRTFKIRRTWMAAKFCQPIYEEFLAEAVSSGRISAPGFFADAAIRKAWCSATWHGDGPGAIDPEKEVGAAEKRVNMGLTTLDEEIVAYDGGSWDQKHPQQTVERAAREKAGLVAPLVAPMAPGAAPIDKKPVPKN